MAKVEIPIAAGFYEDSSKPIAAQECINWIPVVPQTNALSIAQLKGTPGLTSFATNGTKNNRGAHVMDSVAFFVNGNNLYRVNADGTSDDLGVISGSGRVSMADNGTQLCIVVPGVTGYIFTQSPDTLTAITDANYFSLGPSNQVAYKDGYFIHISKDKFFISNLNNGLVYGALDFGTAEVDPDDNTAIHVNRNILYIGGNETIEPFQNVGGADFPFLRIPGGVVQKGVKAKFSVVDFDNSFVFLGGGTNEQPAIWRFTGSSAVKISTEAIDNVISGETDQQLEDAYATVHAKDGGFFVCFHFSGTAFTYDAVATARLGKPVWHERQSRNVSGSPTSWRVASLVQAYGKILVGDTLGPTIGELCSSTRTEYGGIIDRNVSSGPIQNQGLNFFISQLEITTESGVGNTVDPGQNPLITMSMSTDGGYTFGNELTRELGKIGNYEQRQIWRRLGRVARFAMFRFSVSAEVTPVIIKLEADITSGVQ
tara:strand:+ start:26006 stop:27457 length:1452 start_codon:yes stop_codon:yes gene_type:complete